MSTETGSAGVKRRDFLKVLGATGAATTLVGCTSENVGKLIPYVVSPDNTVPGVSNYYATVCREGLEPVGVLAEVRDGRVIIPTDEKVWEVIRRHAASPDAFIQEKIDEVARGDFGKPSI